MDPINETHVSRPGLVVVDVAAADDGASPRVVDTLILDLLDPEEARRPPMAMKDYS
ncbi:DUF6207 family protein, partial [Streptomyces mirabilis]|uniref:DUF6207 family protein n=1 Tax=Streptomyces mirabilis TaxID=68239 RepID=UPI00331E8065